MVIGRMLRISDTNVSVCDITYLPRSNELFEHLSVLWIVNFSLATVFSLIILALYGDMVKHIAQRVHDHDRRVLLYWLCGIFTVFSSISLCAMMVPRASVFCDFVSALYLSFCLYEFYRLMLSYYGSHHDVIVAKLADTKISLQSPPLTCCCPCLPQIDVTEKSLVRIRMTVFQVAFIRPLVTFMAVILLMNGDYNGPDLTLSLSNVSLYITIITACSTMLAMWGLILIFRTARNSYKKYHITAKFFTVQITLIFSNVQPALMQVLASLDLFKCRPPTLSSETIADEWNHFLLIIEMLLMSLVTRKYWRIHPDDENEDDVEKQSNNGTTNQSSPLHFGSSLFSTFKPSIKRSHSESDSLSSSFPPQLNNTPYRSISKDYDIRNPQGTTLVPDSHNNNKASYYSCTNPMVT